MIQNNHQHRDLLIVGFGIAGAVLAWNWVKQFGKTALIVDDCPRSNASRAAAGILNPVTGKRLVKSWNVDALLPVARETYRWIERDLDTRFFHDKIIRRLYQSEEEKNRWFKRSKQAHYQSFLGQTHLPESLSAPIHDELGSFDILGVGNLDTDTFLDTMISWATDQELLVKSGFRHEDLQLYENHVEWNSIHFEQVIFCEGYQVSKNPWFNWLPFKPAKGEILTIEGLGINSNLIFSKHKWLLPTGADTCIAGSTWSWDHLNELPTPQGRSALLQGLRFMLGDTEHLNIVEHRAGIRPCSHDRFPYLGTHPTEPRLRIFNGFGSKGALITPLLAKEMSRFLINGTAFNPDADIKRVIDRYPS